VPVAEFATNAQNFLFIIFLNFITSFKIIILAKADKDIK
jgi:hypothetical protein